MAVRIGTVVYIDKGVAISDGGQIATNKLDRPALQTDQSARINRWRVAARLKSAAVISLNRPIVIPVFREIEGRTNVYAG